MIAAKDEYCHCPHCNRTTRHSIVRERVLAPVLWCLSCYRTRVGEEVVGHGAETRGLATVPPDYRLAG